MLRNNPMPEHRKQILATFLLLVILGFAFYLRAKGMGWGMESGYHQPDERGVIDKAGKIGLRILPREQDESYFSYLKRSIDANLQLNSSLNPKVFHYGSFPYYLMAGTQAVFQDWQTPPLGNGNGLKKLFGRSLIGLAYMILILALFYQFRYRAYSLNWMTWIFLIASCLFWPLIFSLLHQPEALRKLFDPENPQLNYHPFIASIVLFLAPALLILLNTWNRKAISIQASSARLRIVLLLLSGSLIAFLFGYGLPEILNIRWGYGTMGYIGRTYSALAGVGTVALVYSYGSRCYGRPVGFLAAIFLTLTVIHIQLCHFSTFDVTLVFFILLALNFFERVQVKGTLWLYALSGFAVGAAVASKFSGVTLAFLFVLPHLLYTVSISFRGEKIWRVIYAILILVLLLTTALMGTHQKIWNHHLYLIPMIVAGLYFLSLILLFPKEERQEAPASYRFTRCWIGLVLALVIGYYTLYALQPFGFIDSNTFWSNIEEQSNMVTGEGTRPYTIQYLKTTPFFYQVKQLLFRGFGLPLGMLVFAGWLYVLLKQFRRGDPATLLLLAWAIPSFFVYGRFQVKFPRYLITLVPVLCLFGAILINDLLHCAKTGRSIQIPWICNLPSGWIRRGTIAGLFLILFATGTYAFGFLQIYLRPHTWEVASDWIYGNLPRGSKILCEHWDNDLPIGRPGKNRGTMNFSVDNLKVYEQDSPKKIQIMARQLANADYVILPTKRGYGSILRAPERFPYTSNYYRALFSGYIGYEPVKVFTAPAKVWGIPLSDDLMDESLRVYDHPKVVVFKKIEKLPSEQMESLILNAPEWVQSITYEEILTLRDELPVYAKSPRYPILRWYFCIQLIALVFFPFCFPLTQHLRDGGWSLARPMGILILAYLAWLLSNLKLLAFGTQSLWLVLLVCLLIAFLLYRKYAVEIGILIRERYRILLFEEIVWLGILGLFLTIRMNNPDIHWGEKPMDMSFISSVYRTQWFPPLDPWFSGNIINYYYYGHIVIASIGLLAGVPVQYLFNLAVATLPALAFLGAFGLLYNITRKWNYGLLGGYLTTLSGNLYGYLQMSKNLNESVIPDQAGDSFFQSLWILISTPVESFLSVIGLAWKVFKIGLGWYPDPTQGTQFEHWRDIGFDSYFWKCGHELVPNTVANEFPMWTYLFADLHAHMIVMPMTLLFIGLAYALLCTPGRALHLNSHKTSSGWAVLLLCITLGTLFCVNPWDFPTSVLLLLGVLTLKWWKFRPGPEDRGYLYDYGRTIRRFGIRSPWFWRLKMKGFLFSAEVLLPLIAIVFTSILLFLPFHMYFKPRVPLGPGSVLLSLGNMTEPGTYFKIFGVFLFLIISYLLYQWHQIPKRRNTGASSWQWLPILITVASGLYLFFWFDWQTLLKILVVTAIVATLILKLIDRKNVYWGRWNILFILSLTVLTFSGLIHVNSESIIFFLKDSKLFSSFIYLKPNFRNLEFNYTTAALLFPLWIIASVLLARYSHRNRSDAYSLLLIWVGLTVAIGVEVVFVKEGWEHPSHRYNTVFKFFLQIWTYLALAGAAGLYFIRHSRISKIHRSWFSPIRLAWRIWGFGLAILLIASLMFPIFGTYAVTLGPGARCVRGTRPDIDGWKYLNQGSSRAEFLTLHWLNRFVPGQPTLVEDLGLPYRHETSRISTHSGIPTIIGWDHHMRERTAAGNVDQHNREIENRKKDVEQIYRSQEKNSVLDLISKRGGGYLYVGSQERTKYSREVRKFLGYGDAMDLVFHTRGGDLFKIRKNLNTAFLGEAIPLPAPGEQIQESGVNMYIGGEGFDNGNFKEPRGLTTDPKGNVYVADTFNHRIQVFNSKGNYLFQFGQEGDQDGQMKEPNALAIGPNNNIYVLDTWNHRIQVFDSQGKFLYLLGQGFFFGPRGIAIDPNKGELYVSDTGNGQILAFDLEGKYLRRWGSKGNQPNQLYEPVGIAVNDRSEIFVADTGNRKIAIYNRQGNLLRSWSIIHEVPKDGSLNELHLCIAADGNIFLTDPHDGKVLVYDPNGKLLTSLSPKGEIRAPLTYPVGIAINPVTQDLILSDQKENRLKRVPLSVLKR